MRKILLLEFMSLDGVIQGPGAPEEDTSHDFKFGGWTVPFFDEIMGKEMDKQMTIPFDLLLGRKTYDIFAGYWPQRADEWPGADKAVKYVVSKSLKKADWKTSVITPNGVIIAKYQRDGDVKIGSF